MLHKKQLQWTFLLLVSLLAVSLLTLEGAVKSIQKRHGENFCDIGNWRENARELSFSQERNITSSRQFTTKLVGHAIVSSSEPGLYLFSALDDSCPIATRQNRNIVVTGWKKKTNSTFKDFRCCLYREGHITSVTAKLRKTRYRYKESYFNGIQCLCPVYFTQSSVNKVSLIQRTKMCSQEISHYIDVETVAPRKVNGVVLCAKVLYGNVEANRLIEWFEAQIFLGISKILCYVHKDLNTDALEVLKYYEKQGVVTPFPFDVPDNETYPRHLWQKTKTAWTDAGIAVLDCQQRMNTYKYGVFIDIDEILIPEGMELQNSIPRYLEKEFLSNTSLALLKFKSLVHITSWGLSNPSHPLYFGKYVNSTVAMNDRTKYAYRPDTVIPGSCLSHACRMKTGYGLRMRTSAKVHHFRSCRKEWMKDVRNADPELNKDALLVKMPTGNICVNFKKNKLNQVKLLADKIKDGVLRVRSFLNGTDKRRRR